MKREFNVGARGPSSGGISRNDRRKPRRRKVHQASGGRGQYGHVKLRVKPGEKGSGFVSLTQSKAVSIPKEFINPTEKGVKEAIDKGIVAAITW